jgi:hypothetical protein
VVKKVLVKKVLVKKVLVKKGVGEGGPSRADLDSNFKIISVFPSTVLSLCVPIAIQVHSPRWESGTQGHATKFRFSSGILYTVPENVKWLNGQHSRIFVIDISIGKLLSKPSRTLLNSYSTLLYSMHIKKIATPSECQRLI